MKRTTELSLTIKPDTAEAVSFYLSLPEILHLAGLPMETGLDYLASQAARPNPAVRSIKEVLSTQQTVIVAQLGNFTRSLNGHPGLSVQIVQVYLAALFQAFELKQKELDVVMAIDAIRDNSPEPAAMLAEIVGLLAECLEADFCLLYLLEPKSGQMALAAIKERSQKFGRPEALIPLELVERAAELDHAVIWTAQEAPGQLKVDVPETLQLAAVPVIMGEAEHLGVLMLARAAKPFSFNDLQLLKTAEDHIDSAIIQMWVAAEKRHSEETLALKHKELAMIQAIDAIRDAGLEPQQILRAIANYLAQAFEAELCLLFLLNHHTGQVELGATNDTAKKLDQLQQILTTELAETIAGLECGLAWAGNEVLSVESQAKAPQNLCLAAIPIIMNADKRLGALLLARRETPFSPNDIQLLKTAEDQIDSAIIQANIDEEKRRSEKTLILKQRELTIIEAIDKIRDTEAEPAGLLRAIANCLAQEFKADLCLLFLLDHDTGEVELKAASDDSEPFAQLQDILASELAARATQLANGVSWDGYEVLPAQARLSVPKDLKLAAAPIITETLEHLGALVLARVGLSFEPDEIQLLEIAEDQVDSAVIQVYADDRLREHTKELETIYRIDYIRDQDLPLEEMLKTTLEELNASIAAQMGFVMLYDRLGKELEMRAAIPASLSPSFPGYEEIGQAVHKALETAQLICRNDLDRPLHSLMCLPLILNERIIGVLGVINSSGPRGFTGADRRLLRAIGSQIDTAIYERREIRQLRQVLGRSVDPRVMEHMLTTSDGDFLKGELLELTVLYADIRGSTRLAEETNPELLVEFIKDYLSRMTAVILAYEGTVDKFVGDEVMALFGAPVHQKDHALRAVRVGLALQQEYQAVLEKWQQHGVKAGPIGVGIATGPLIAGAMGSAQRAEYTVIGRAANLGARICSVAQGGEVLISQATYDMAKYWLIAAPRPGQNFKGLGDNVTVYHVTGLLDG